MGDGPDTIKKRFKRWVEQFRGKEVGLNLLECRFDADHDGLKDVAFFAGSSDDYSCTRYYAMHSSELDVSRRQKYQQRLENLWRDDFQPHEALTYPLTLHKAYSCEFP